MRHQMKLIQTTASVKAEPKLSEKANQKMVIPMKMKKESNKPVSAPTPELKHQQAHATVHLLGLKKVQGLLETRLSHNPFKQMDEVQLAIDSIDYSIKQIEKQINEANEEWFASFKL